MKKKLIIFDCFGVIFGEVAPVFLRRFLPREKADALKERLFVPADLGQVTYDELMTDMAKALGMEKKEMIPQWEELFILRSEIVPVIKELGKSNDIALLSNAPEGVVEGLLDRFNLWDLFNKTVISSAVKMAKPDKAIYEYCVSLFEGNYEKIYMVDDNIANLEHLPSIGITPIHYKTVEDLKVIE